MGGLIILDLFRDDINILSGWDIKGATTLGVPCCLWDLCLNLSMFPIWLPLAPGSRFCGKSSAAEA